MSINSRKISNYCILLILLAGVLSAQTEEIEIIETFIKKKRDNAAYLLGGVQFLRLNGLNDRFNALDIGSLPEEYLCYGLGGHVIENNILFGVEVFKVMDRASDINHRYKSYAFANYYLLNLGYQIYAKKGLSMYPIMGIGLCKGKIKVMEYVVDSFDDITEFQQESWARKNSIFLNLGYGMDTYIRVKRSKTRTLRVLLGLRFGYYHALGSSKWRINDFSVDDGPDGRMKGPYVHVILGLSGLIEKFIERNL